MKVIVPSCIQHGLVVNFRFRLTGLILLVLIISPSLKAQFSKLDYERLTSSNGIPATPISGIVQDRRGYLWIGTPTGLFRYNGVSSKGYFADESVKSLPDNLIQQLEYIDDKVIALTPGGTFVHNCQTEQDTTLFLNGVTTAPMFLANNMTHACSDGEGGLLLLSRSGFMHVNALFQKQYEYIHPDSNQAYSISGSFGRVIFPMPDKKFILAGYHGLYVYDPIEKSTMPLQEGSYPVLDQFIRDQSINVFEQSPFTYLFFSRHQGRLLYYDTKLNVSFSLSIAREVLSLLKSNTQWHFINDSLVCVLLPGKGTIMLHVDRKTRQMMMEAIQVEGLLPITMAMDQNHRIWLGTHNGLYKQRHLSNGIRKSSPAFDAELPQKSHAQFGISGPYLVTGTAEGMVMKFYDKQSLVLVKEINVSSSIHTNTSGILHFATYGEDSILICTRGPRIWLNTQDWKHNAVDPWLENPTRHAWYAFESKIDGAIYTIQNSSSLERFDPIAKRFKTITIDKDLAKELRTPTQISEDWNGDLWISHDGFCRYHQASGHIEYCRTSFPGAWLDRNGVGNMVMDSAHKVMWFTLQRNGIIRYEPETNKYIQFTTKQGLPDRIISQMLLVDRHIWLITPSGLASISIDNFNIRRYPYGRGANLHYARKALTYDPETDQLFFMDDEDIMACRPNALLNNLANERLLIEQVDCGNNTWYWPDQSKLDIHGKHRNLRIQLSCVSFEDTAPLQYNYRFKSAIDTTWRNIGNDGVTIFENLPPGKHDIQFRLVSTGNDIEPIVTSLHIQVHPVFWETNLFRGSLAILCLVAMWRIFVWQFQKKKAKMDLDRKLTELELDALRSRMNPHFIFNCLNSINRYILKEDKGKASYYLSQFAKLIRHILDYTTESNVSLADELGVTRLYIELESLRMNNPIQLEIILDPSIDSDNIRVPPLFIQPYVENAIWHGLAPKKEDLRLWVRVNKRPNGYVFEIEDNGIGRVAAGHYKKQGQHISKGLTIARETFERYGQVYQMNTTVEINDLLNVNGASSGTCVRLTLNQK